MTAYYCLNVSFLMFYRVFLLKSLTKGKEKGPSIESPNYFKLQETVLH